MVKWTEGIYGEGLPKEFCHTSSPSPKNNQWEMQLC